MMQEHQPADLSEVVEETLMDHIEPFRIEISDDALADLQHRLRATRWPDPETPNDWSQGIPLAYVQEVCRYWAEEYDWRATETRLNAVKLNPPCE